MYWDWDKTESDLTGDSDSHSDWYEERGKSKTKRSSSVSSKQSSELASELSLGEQIEPISEYTRELVGVFDVDKFAKCNLFELNIGRQYINLRPSSFKTRLFDAKTKACVYCRKFFITCDLKLSHEESKQTRLIVKKFLNHIKSIELKLKKILIRGAGTRKIKGRFPKECDGKKVQNSSKSKSKSKPTRPLTRSTNADPSHTVVQNVQNVHKQATEARDAYHQLANRYLYVDNLKNDCTPVQLSEIFAKFGLIVNLNIEYRISNGESNTNAVVEYYKVSSTVRAIESLNGKKSPRISDTRINLDFCQTFTSNCITIHNIVSTLNFETIREQCCSYSRYHKFEIDESDRTCLVCYDSMEEAKQVLTFLKGVNIESKKLQVDYASMDFIKTFEKYTKPQDQLTLANSIIPILASPQPPPQSTSSDVQSSNLNNYDAGQPAEPIEEDMLEIDNFTSLFDFICQPYEEFQSEIVSSNQSPDAQASSSPDYQMNISSINQTTDSLRNSAPSRKQDEMDYCFEPELFVVEPTDDLPYVNDIQNDIKKPDDQQVLKLEKMFIKSKPIKLKSERSEEMFIEPHLDRYRQIVQKMEYKDHSKVVRVANPYFVGLSGEPYDVNENIVMVELNDSE